MMAVAASVKDGGEPVRLFDEMEAQKMTRMGWWTQARFGMFIHFGLYSLPGRHEWVKSLEQMDSKILHGCNFFWHLA